jgi:hypothetical protein
VRHVGAQQAAEGPELLGQQQAAEGPELLGQQQAAEEARQHAKRDRECAWTRE